MAIRFQLLPYLYTLFYHAHNRGDTVMRAMAWEFPNDPSLVAADRQFFLGPSILVIPVLNQGDTTVDGVFPGLAEGTDVYYDWYNHSQIAVPSVKNTTIEAPLGHIPVYIRGGSILAMQQPAMTTRDARKTAWSILAATGADGNAAGTLYLDDGESISPNATKSIDFSSFTYEGRATINVGIVGSYEGLDTPLANVTILGVTKAPENGTVTINGKQVGMSVYDEKTQSLFAGDLQEVMGGNAWGDSWSITFR